MRKSSLTLALTSLLAFSIAFSGCTGKKAENASAQATTDSGMIGNMYKSGMPILKEKATFKMLAVRDVRMQEFNEMKLFKDLEAASNIHVEWDYSDAANMQQKLNLVMASGEYPDAIFSGLSQAVIAKYAPQGVFTKLDKLIEDYAPNIKNAFSQKPLYKKILTSTDGSIYTLSNASESEEAYNPDQMFIYKPWLDKLGLKSPTTTDELYTVLKAFKEKDPNGNGIADEIPFSCRFGGGDIQGMHSLFAAFGYADLIRNIKVPNPTDHFVAENGKVVFTADKPEWKAAVEYYNKFFAEGLFDKESFTQDAKQYFAKGKTKDVTLGSFILWNAVNMAGPERENDYIPVEPLKGSTGKKLWTKVEASNGNITAASFAITSKCKTPEVLIRWADYMYDKKISAQFMFGPVGVVLKEGANGILEYMETPAGLSFDEFRYKNTPAFGPAALFSEDIGKVIVASESAAKKIDIKRKIYDPYAKSVTLPGLKFTDEENQYFAAQGTDIQNYVNDQLVKWLMSGGIDKDWSAYTAKLSQLKLDEYVKKMQTAYERFSK